MPSRPSRRAPPSPLDPASWDAILAVSPASRSREGPLFAQTGSPAWATTTVHARRVDRLRLERVRFLLSGRGRIAPLWEALSYAIAAAERELAVEPDT